MAPSVEMLIALADAIRELAPSGVPHVDTQGFAEIIDDSKLTGDQLGHLGASTHSLAGLSLLAASDHARAFARLHSHAPAPAFAHIALTRAALEALVWARWLGEPGPKVTPAERRRRGLSARLYSVYEEAKLAELKQDALGRAERLEAVAAASGWTVTGKHRGDLFVGGKQLPSISAEFNRLLTLTEIKGFGSTLWSYLCGVAHGTLYGMLSGIYDSHADPLDPETTIAVVGSDSRKVNSLVLLLVRGLRTVTAERLSLMGWQSDAWDKAALLSHEWERQVVRAMYGIELPPGHRWGDHGR